MEKKRFIGCWNKSVILTYIGVALSVLGILELLMHNNLKLALTCLILAGICDMYDGTVARMCKRTDEEKQFGVQIDSLADVICSVIFPVIIYFHSVEINENIRQTINSELLTVVIGAIYSICGISRLAWFNIKTANTETKTEYYTGLAVTFIALILPVMHLVGFIFDLCNLTYYLTMLITAIMFVGNFKVKKPGKVTYIIFLILAVIAITMIQIFIK